MANRKAQNDKPNRGEPDEYDRDLARDSSGGTDENRGMSGLAGPSADGGEPRVAHDQFLEGAGTYNDQKDRKGQAQSPRELTHNEPPRKKEGH